MDKQKDCNTILFDAGGVLFDTKIRSDERIKNILRAKGYDEKKIAKAIVAANEFSVIAMETGPWLDTWEKEEVYWDNYYRKILEALGDVNNYSLRKQLLFQTHYTVNCFLFEEVKEVLKKLHGKYKLGVISNALPSIDWVFDFLDIRKYFENIVISSLVGSSKPENKIFEFAINSFEVLPEDCYFIDDSLKNVEAAMEMGFRGLHLDRTRDDLRCILKQLET